eukprot:6933400-Pyramimonas_sp.AAC.1
MTASGVVEIKRLHGMESMACIGWDMSFWRDGKPPFTADKSVTPELLNDLAGNAWSAFQFTPVCIAAIGAAD